MFISGRLGKLMGHPQLSRNVIIYSVILNYIREGHMWASDSDCHTFFSKC